MQAMQLLSLGENRGLIQTDAFVGRRRQFESNEMASKRTYTLVLHRME